MEFGFAMISKCGMALDGSIAGLTVMQRALGHMLLERHIGGQSALRPGQLGEHLDMPYAVAVAHIVALLLDGDAAELTVNRIMHQVDLPNVLVDLLFAVKAPAACLADEVLLLEVNPLDMDIEQETVLESPFADVTSHFSRWLGIGLW